MNQSLSASIIIQNKNNTWMNDNFVYRCHCCSTEFTLFVRKHHCRNCGNIFCYTCSNYYTIIPPFILDVPEPEDYWNISHYISKNNDVEVRVCQECYININKKIQFNKVISEIFKKPLQFNQLKSYNIETKTHYYDYFRNIQYYLPNHSYTDVDKKILQINSQFFCKHSKYLMHYIKSISWNTKRTTKLKNVVAIINGNRNKSCEELFCTRTCSEMLSFDDCISILYSVTDDFPEQLIIYLFTIIQKTPSTIIMCHLQFFVNLIKNNNDHEYMNKFIFNILTLSNELKYRTIWYLLFTKNCCTHLQINNINKFIELFDKHYLQIVSREYNLFTEIILNFENLNKILSDYFYTYGQLSLPYNSEIKLIGVDYDNIVVKSSKTRPIVVPFITTTNTIVNVLFKKENVINDIAVLNLIQLSNIILEEHFEENCNSIVYSVMPITLDSGIIELIDNAETVYTIGKNNKSIFQHIVEKNENECYINVSNRYVASLVAYTLQSYFFGLGDRHLQNIMIHNNGSIFHIDFGYILGTDTYPITASDIKLNDNILNVLGDKKEIKYKKYKDQCSNGFILLRKYFNMFFILFNVSTNFDEKYIEKFILSRFQPRQSDIVVVNEFNSIIDKSNNSYTGYFKDFAHYHTQEKTVQTTISNALHSVFNMIIKS